jgi:hypothetical protein
MYLGVSITINLNLISEVRWSERLFCVSFIFVDIRASSGFSQTTSLFDRSVPLTVSVL